MGDDSKTDKSKSAKRNHRRDADDIDRDVRVLMKKTGASHSQMLALLHRYGRDLASIERAAMRLKPT